MTAVPDPLVALVAYLKADTDVTALVGSRVYGGELPDTENANMPRDAVVLRLAGSPNTYGNGYQEFGDSRVEVRSYGATVYQATLLGRTVHGRLKIMRRNIQSGTILHWAQLSGGHQQLRDPDTEWPFDMSTWQVLAAERL